MLRICPNPNCTNTTEFEADAVQYQTEFYTSTGEFPYDSEGYDTETISAIRCSICSTTAIEQDD